MRTMGELARSDRTVHDLTGQVGEAQNLISAFPTGPMTAPP